MLFQRARGRLGADATLAPGNVIELPFPSDTFERVYCSEVFEHLSDPATARDEIRRLLKAGGVAVLWVPNESLINASKRPLRRGLLRVGRAGYEMSERL